MKKVLYIASMCLAMAFTSCDDFLTVSSPDKLTTGNFGETKKMQKPPWPQHTPNSTTATAMPPVKCAGRWRLTAPTFTMWVTMPTTTRLGQTSITSPIPTEIHSSLITTKTFTGVSTSPTRCWSTHPKSRQKTSPKPNAKRLLPKLIF